MPRRRARARSPGDHRHRTAWRRRTIGARSRSSWCAGATTSRRSSGSVSRGAGPDGGGPARLGLAQPATALATAPVDGVAAAPAPGAVADRRGGRLERPEDRESRRADVEAPLGGFGLHAGVPIGPARAAAARRPRGESSRPARVHAPPTESSARSPGRPSPPPSVRFSPPQSFPARHPIEPVFHLHQLLQTLHPQQPTQSQQPERLSRTVDQHPPIRPTALIFCKGHGRILINGWYEGYEYFCCWHRDSGHQAHEASCTRIALSEGRDRQDHPVLRDRRARRTGRAPSRPPRRGPPGQRLQLARPPPGCRPRAPRRPPGPRQPPRTCSTEWRRSAPRSA